ncbi:pilus assembly FimT family protein [Acinetobacter puyangensis]|uniref:pilus assembly FimT family protein n=1 Tax=Acinetobacter puyangensis TaxID=1096779 RepID=UPI003A4D4294
MMRFKHSRGFTLVELMVTIAVMAIIAMMAAPSFDNLIAEKRLDSETRELALVLSDVRGQAAALRKNITIKFEAGTNTATVFYWTPKSSNIVLDDSDQDVSFADITYTPIGVPKQRKVDKPNPAYDKEVATDLTTNPPTNPPTIEVIVPLKFKLCNSEIKQSRTISISLNGTIQQIEKGGC